ncbi:class I SAM-dependent methyltransferase [Tessaracoccus terricola]
MHPDTTALRHRLNEIGYTVDAVLDRIGEAGQEALGRNTTLAADVALGDAMDPLAVLIRLFLLQQAVPAEHVAAALDLSDLVAQDVLRLDGDEVVALLDIRPYDSPDDGASGFLASDLTPGMDSATSATRPDYVLGASPASLTLAQLIVRDDVGSALDLGTGCGVQALHLARHCGRVVGTDLNERALECARLTAELSGIDVDLRHGSLYEPVAGERFDLIVSNPPYVMSPPGDDGDRLTYREGTHTADGLVEAVVRGAAEHLNPGGTAQFLVNWAVTADQQWTERLRGWVAGTGLDCWVIERERMDRYSYIELWLTDAGLAGSEEWLPAYRRWLDYFDELGIEEVGMGWIMLTAAGRQEPQLRFETWPHAVVQPVGLAFAQDRAAVDASLLPLAELLAATPRLADVKQETIGEPGAADPQHIVLRQRTGLLRAIEVGTAEAAVLGALDGELTVGQVLAAVAQVLEVDAAELAAEVVPVIRDALRDQLLVLGPEGEALEEEPDVVGALN